MSSPNYRSSEITGWVGWIAFAAFFMIVSGILNIIQGFAALFKDDWFVVTKSGLLTFDYTSWGWIHIIFGALVALVGAALLKGATWARVVGTILVGLNLIAQFAWLPAYPVWAVVLIAMDILILWAILVHGGEARDLDEMG